MIFGQMRLFTLLGLLFVSVDILACSCEHIGIMEHKKEADVVFKGRVTEIVETETQIKDPRTNFGKYTVTRYTFEILQNHKGLKGKSTIDIVTGWTDCELYRHFFRKSKKYIVYAYSVDEQESASYYTTHLCSRTRKTNLLTFWESLILRLT
jgi:hypothetical protein